MVCDADLCFRTSDPWTRNRFARIPTATKVTVYGMAVAVNEDAGASRRAQAGQGGSHGREHAGAEVATHEA